MTAMVVVNPLHVPTWVFVVLGIASVLCLLWMGPGIVRRK